MKHVSKIFRHEIAEKGTVPFFKRGQIFLEFIFSMVIIMLMVYTLVMVFKWAGQDLVSRRQAHDEKLTSDIKRSYTRVEDGPMKQIDPNFYRPVKLKAVYGEEN